MIHHKHRTILGPIPADWDNRPVGSLLAEQLAGDWGDDSGEVALAVLRSTNFTDAGCLDLRDVAKRWFSARNAPEIQVCPNDILLERSGGGPDRPVGRVVFVPDEMPRTGFANFVQCLRPNREVVHPQFLLWLLFQLHRCGEVTRVQHQTTQMRNLDLRDYLRLRLPYPDTPEEQTRIAETLKAADDHIRALEEQLRKAVGVRKALMQEEFSIPDEHVELPTVGTIIVEQITNGYSPVCPTFETGAWVLGLDALTDEGFDPNGRKPAPRDDQNLAGNEIRKGDIFASRSNTRERVGLAGLYNGDPPNCYYPDLMMRIRVDLERVRPKYLDLFLRSEFARRFVQSRAGGTSGSMVKIKERDIRQMPLVLPGLDEQDIVIDRFDSASMLVSALKSQIGAARRLKKSLLQNLLTGRIRLKP